jgi:L-threonylcarbamoyladenylate synthase
MPAHEVALALIRESKKAIAAPSANTFGYVSPTEASHVAQDLSGKIDLILDGGKCSLGVESTIISLAGANPVLLRPGATPVEEIEDVAGKLERHTPRPDRPQAPGELARHYATRTPLDLVSGREAELSIHPGEKVGILALRPPSHPERYAATEVLSHSGNLREAAANLFSSLRRLDDMGLDRLVAFPVPETGLGIAIMDRLRRCARGV